MSIACAQSVEKFRRASKGYSPSIFTDIYQDDVNMVIWQRPVSPVLASLVNIFLKAHPSFSLSITVDPKTALSALSEIINPETYPEIVENVVELVDMFGCLFELKSVGLRLTALDKPMCPKFHVDHVPCRLITTFQGVATEWLDHAIVDRSKLGSGSGVLKDAESGLYSSASDIQQLSCGDVALLKGEYWFDNEYAGLVHRSPFIEHGESRLLLTLDFAD